MNKIYYIIIALSVSFTSFYSCSDEELGKMNVNQGEFPEPHIPYLYTRAIKLADPFDYLHWFYNNEYYYLPWTQATTLHALKYTEVNLVDEYANQEDLLFEMKMYVETLKDRMKQEGEQGAQLYGKMAASLTALQVHMAIFGTDSHGSIAYSEAGLANINPNALTPAYQTQEELFDLWLKELDEAMSTLTKQKAENERDPFPIGSQDLIYKGDYTKWAKFANSIKLKIAVRLVNTDLARAKKIAEEVVNSPVGYLDDLSDDYIYNVGSQEYHFGDEMRFGAGNEQLINYLVDNKDPRVRFMFAKNEFNSTIVDGFLKAEKDLPSYVLATVNVNTDASGNKSFGSWKAPGTPWVRYQGAPIDLDQKQNPEYFVNDHFQLEDAKKESKKSYKGTSIYNEEMVRGQKDHAYPSLPGVTPFEDNIDRSWYGAHLTAAEVNLYLAEFKLIGANLPKSADAYFTRGIELSVREMDKLADLNQIPYYTKNAGFDANDVEIALVESEIDSLLKQPSYQLTGSKAEQLEKIYMQQYIHALQNPNELFVLVRRTGFPYDDGVVYKRLPFDSKNSNFIIPRRFIIRAPKETDLMYSIKKNAYEQQGFTTTTNEPSILSKERLWYDKSAPEYGKRPSY